MKFKTEILEMARIACASIPDTIVDEMDASDDFFVEIRDYIQGELNEMSEKKKYYIGVSILNCYEVDAKNKEEAEEIVSNYSNEEILEDSDFNVNYIDEIK